MKIEELSEFDEVVKMPPKNKRRYLLIPKNKIIQTITAWRFPCVKKVFTFSKEIFGEYLVATDWFFKTKKAEELWSCACQKENCKPEKIKIIVMKEG